jgi:chromosome segregation ATPase
VWEGEDMSDKVEGLSRRVSAVEAQVERLREDGATTRMMAAMADRDVAEYRQVARAQMGVLNALRETQLEQSRVLVEHGQILGALVAGHQETTHRLATLEAGQTTLETGQNHMSDRLATLETGQTTLEAGQNHMSDRLATLETGQTTLETGQNHMSDRLGRVESLLATIVDRLPERGA